MITGLTVFHNVVYMTIITLLSKPYKKINKELYTSISLIIVVNILNKIQTKLKINSERSFNVIKLVSYYQYRDASKYECMSI